MTDSPHGHEQRKWIVCRTHPQFGAHPGSAAKTVVAGVLKQAAFATVNQSSREILVARVAERLFLTFEIREYGMMSVIGMRSV